GAGVDLTIAAAAPAIAHVVALGVDRTQLMQTVGPPCGRTQDQVAIIVAEERQRAAQDGNRDLTSDQRADGVEGDLQQLTANQIEADPAADFGHPGKGAVRWEHEPQATIKIAPLAFPRRVTFAAVIGISV